LWNQSGNSSKFRANLQQFQLDSGRQLDSAQSSNFPTLLPTSTIFILFQLSKDNSEGIETSVEIKLRLCSADNGGGFERAWDSNAEESESLQ
jgi:hypothetical protein